MTWSLVGLRLRARIFSQVSDVEAEAYTPNTPSEDFSASLPPLLRDFLRPLV